MLNKDMETLSLVATQQRLVAWGHWYNALLLSGIGHSRESIISQLIKNKGYLTKGTNPIALFDNPEAEQVDALLNHYRHLQPENAKVIKVHYSDNASFVEKLNRLSLNKGTYFRRLKQGEKWLSHLLSH